MAATYDALTDRALTLLKASPVPASRLVVGVAGAPGAGKSTLASAVAARLCAALGDATAAVVLPMDGFHLTKAELAQFPDPTAAFARRGAPTRLTRPLLSTQCAPSPPPAPLPSCPPLTTAWGTRLQAA